MNGLYTISQVERLLDDILQNIPGNDPKFLGIKKYIESKKKHIHEHI